MNVFGTPALISLFEAAAVNAISAYLKSDETSVGTNAKLSQLILKGTSINVTHTAATPVGLQVRAEATVTAIEGRKVKFSVIAYDEKEKIGEGTHERFILNKERFETKALEKAKKQ